MSITKEKATRVLECMAIDMVGAIAGMRETDPMLDVLQQRIEAVDLAQSALRPVSREQVEKVRGEWKPGDPVCTVCGRNKFSGLDADIWADWMPSFCPHCGAPITDEAVQMVMERLNELYGESET